MTEENKNEEQKKEQSSEVNASAEQKTDVQDTAPKGDSSDQNKARGERSDRGPRGRGQRGRGPRGAGGRPQGQRTEAPASDFVEKVLAIKRVTKVTKGGKKLSFSALVVVGDTKGRVGYSLSKAGEVAAAIRKSLNIAKKNMVTVPMHGSTIPHEIIGVCGGAEVLLKPASEGTGVIASGPVRAVCDGAGIHNILTKCHRSNNPINVVKATFDGFSRLKSKASHAST